MYRGLDLVMQRPVAVKLVRTREGVRIDEAITGRFLREAKHTARIVHENIIDVFDLGRSEVVCQGPLTWRIPTKPTFSLNKSSTKAQVGARAETDYRERFFDGATARIKALTNGKLRLGYKPLE